MARVVGIHGAFHELWGPNQVASRWLPAIRDGLWHHGATLDGDDFDVAFYGDLFRNDPATGRPDDDQLLDVARTSGLVEIAEAEMGPGGLEALAEELGREVLRKLIDQLARYFADTEVRHSVRGRLEERIDSNTRVIVAHSMGTVVAYETLSQHPEWPVTTFVTLGSPLGGPFVQSRLLPDSLTGARPWPAGLQHWTNVAARGDTVVADPDLSRFFEGPIDNRAVDNGRRTHDAEPYLNASVTGHAIARALSDS